MKKSLIILLLSFMPLFALAQKDFKLVESSRSQKPSWLINGGSHDAFLLQANRMSSLDDAKSAVMAELLSNIASSVAVQVTGSIVQDVDWTAVGDREVYMERIKNTTTTEIAEMPALKGVSISKADVYWEKYYNKKTNESYYDYYILYPFTSYDLDKLIEEYNKIMSAPQYSSEWDSFTKDGFLFDIQGEKKTSSVSESVLVNRLIEAARGNIAKQILVKIKDNMGKADFVNDMDVSLLQTRSYFNPNVNKMFVIAFIDKANALRFYDKQIDVVFNNVEKHVTITDTYVETGFKSKAKEEIRKAENEFAKLEKPIFFLTVFDCPEYEFQEVLRKYSDLEQTVKRKISDLEYGTNIFVDCKADMFGQNYLNLNKELKAKLAENGCNFVDDRNLADWVVIINANSREYNKVDFGNSVNYFSYVDAEIALEKVVTNQRIYEDMITEKGGHTHNYGEAARAAYKKITPKIIELINENIK